jgi:hypothetical protein
MYCVNSLARVVGNVFQDNQANPTTPYRGGGMFAEGSSYLEVVDNVFVENRGEKGGGLFAIQCGLARIEGNRFERNASDPKGGGGLWLEYCASYVVRGNVFLENEVVPDNAVGGGLVVFESGGTIEENLFLRNTAGKAGGGIGTRGGAATVRRNTLVGNSVQTVTTGGSGMTLNEGTCLVQSNLVTDGLGGIAAITCDGGVGALFECNDVFNHGTPSYLGCPDPTGTFGNFSANPAYCDPATDDYTLADHSPALPGNHPDGADCGIVGAYGAGGCGMIATTPTTWGWMKGRFR